MFLNEFNEYKTDVSMVSQEYNCSETMILIKTFICCKLYGACISDYLSARLEYKDKKGFSYLNVVIEKHFGNLPARKQSRIKLDFIINRIFHGTKISDYFQYDFYRYKQWVRDEFVNEQRRLIIDSTFNSEEDSKIFHDKVKFCKKFGPYLKRDWLDTSKCDFENFEQFITKHPVFFGKPMSGSYGKETGYFDIHDYENHVELFKQFQKKSMLLEQLICQSEELSEFNKTSVNTLRIVTVLRPNGEAKIMTADIRMGREGKTSDNFHNMGIAALIDIKTGIVYTKGIDKQGKKYIVHPDSKKQIIGYKIPNWQEVIAFAKELARVVPDVHYVGWDIAICDDGPCVVEGNNKADPDVTQMPDGIGKWPLYKPLIDEAKQSGKYNIK